jgi:hypothetical protein
MEKRNRCNGFMKVGVIVFVLLLILMNSSSLLAAEQGDCEDGLLRCIVTAAITSFGDPKVGAAVLAFCAIGYAWCKEFYTG